MPHTLPPEPLGLVPVPGGTVTLADRRTRHRWNVGLAPFLLGQTPVTRSLYARVTGDRPSTAAEDRLPVESVSWLEAVGFCNTLSSQHGLRAAYRFTRDGGVDADPAADGFRLPTEAEWEHACRAGTDGPRYGTLDDIGWYRDNASERLQAVGQKQPNAWGLHDMLGNVWEWCWDLYDPEVYGTYRVLRGGGWADPHWSCRASVRRRSHPTLALDDIGFRLARTPSSRFGAHVPGRAPTRTGQ